jgi:hypothetical protein
MLRSGAGGRKDLPAIGRSHSLRRVPSVGRGTPPHVRNFSHAPLHGLFRLHVDEHVTWITTGSLLAIGNCRSCRMAARENGRTPFSQAFAREFSDLRPVSGMHLGRSLRLAQLVGETASIEALRQRTVASEGDGHRDPTRGRTPIRSCRLKPRAGGAWSEPCFIRSTRPPSTITYVVGDAGFRSRDDMRPAVSDARPDSRGEVVMGGGSHAGR